MVQNRVHEQVQKRTMAGRFLHGGWGQRGGWKEWPEFEILYGGSGKGARPWLVGFDIIHGCHLDDTVCIVFDLE